MISLSLLVPDYLLYRGTNKTLTSTDITKLIIKSVVIRFSTVSSLPRVFSTSPIESLHLHLKGLNRKLINTDYFKMEE